MTSGLGFGFEVGRVVAWGRVRGVPHPFVHPGILGWAREMRFFLALHPFPYAGTCG
ncbi:MAG: hypothetical protein ABDK94_07695 [Atribacterota bacterium]